MATRNILQIAARLVSSDGRRRRPQHAKQRSARGGCVPDVGRHTYAPARLLLWRPGTHWSAWRPSKPTDQCVQVHLQHAAHGAAHVPPPRDRGAPICAGRALQSDKSAHNLLQTPTCVWCCKLQVSPRTLLYCGTTGTACAGGTGGGCAQAVSKSVFHLPHDSPPATCSMRIKWPVGTGKSVIGLICAARLHAALRRTAAPGAAAAPAVHIRAPSGAAPAPRPPPGLVHGIQRVVQEQGRAAEASRGRLMQGGAWRAGASCVPPRAPALNSLAAYRSPHSTGIQQSHQGSQRSKSPPTVRCGMCAALRRLQPCVPAPGPHQGPLGGAAGWGEAWRAGGSARAGSVFQCGPRPYEGPAPGAIIGILVARRAKSTRCQEHGARCKRAQPLLVRPLAPRATPHRSPSLLACRFPVLAHNHLTRRAAQPLRTLRQRSAPRHLPGFP